MTVPRTSARWARPSTPESAVRRRLLVAIVLATGVLVASCATGPRPAPPPPCLTSTAPAGFTSQVCLRAPAPGATVTGTVPVTTTVGSTGAPPLNGLTYTLDGSYLLFDAQAPYRFSWHTGGLPPGPHVLTVSAVFSGGYASPPVSTTVTVTAAPPPPPAPPFVPADAPHRGPNDDVVVAAAGDGASGMTAEQRVADEIAGWRPDLFFYLGDVYGNGSPEEFANWYGENGTFYSRFRSITDPVIGNHEYVTGGAAPYFAYWGQVPHYYSLDAGAWHVIALDDTVEFRASPTDSPQYRWLSADLENDHARCTLVMWHRPVFSLDSGDPPATEFQDYWRLLAAHHVTAVLTGHAHNYQRWTPLDGNGDPAPDGVTQLVAGTGGQWISPLVGNDPRLVAHDDAGASAWGALRLDLAPTGAGFRFTTIAGQIPDQGVIPCRGPSS